MLNRRYARCMTSGMEGGRRRPEDEGGDLERFNILGAPRSGQCSMYCVKKCISKQTIYTYRIRDRRRRSWEGIENASRRNQNGLKNRSGRGGGVIHTNVVECILCTHV